LWIPAFSRFTRPDRKSSKASRLKPFVLFDGSGDLLKGYGQGFGCSSLAELCCSGYRDGEICLGYSPLPPPILNQVCLKALKQTADYSCRSQQIELISPSWTENVNLG
jgi:hypothetical protein